MDKFNKSRWYNWLTENGVKVVATGKTGINLFNAFTPARDKWEPITESNMYDFVLHHSNKVIYVLTGGKYTPLYIPTSLNQDF